MIFLFRTGMKYVQEDLYVAPKLSEYIYADIKTKATAASNTVIISLKPSRVPSDMVLYKASVFHLLRQERNYHMTLNSGTITICCQLVFLQ